MMRLGRAAISAVGILVALTLVGVAAAGNGNGNGAGNSGANGAEHAAEAPGQVKKDATPAPQSAPVPVSAPAVTAAPTQAPPAAPAASSPTDPGVKPSNSTSKNTSCVTGQGSGGTTCTGGSKPDSSKQYGNGTTAAQIATSRGGDSVTLKGPGNSQPHKVVACGHRHAVDVHAIKHYNASGCAETPTSTPDPKPAPNPSPNPTPNPSPNPTPPGNPGDPSSTPSPHGHITGGRVDPSVRVLGDTTRQTHTRSSKPASAVLAEVAAAVPVLHGTLPFTGFPLWALVLVAAGLIAIGIALRMPEALTRAHARRRTDRRGSGAA